MRLAIAFGARGKGNALAHYEPSRAVINLTKMKGAGSLAHEFGHALDDMLGVRAGLRGPNTFLSDNITGKMTYREPEVSEAMKQVVQAMCKKEISVSDEIKQKKAAFEERQVELLEIVEKTVAEINDTGKAFLGIENIMSEMLNNYHKAVEQLRKEQETALGSFDYNTLSEINKRAYDLYRRKREIVSLERIDKYGDEKEKTIRHRTDFYEWARKLDQGRKKEYYSALYEMFARCFESFIEDTLYERGIISQYLVHSTRANKFYGEYKPYPEGEERKAINKAIANLLDVVRTQYKDEFGKTNYAIFEDKESFESYQDSIVTVKIPKKRKKVEPKQGETKSLEIESLQDLRDAITSIGGNNTKRGTTYSQAEYSKILNGLANAGKKNFGFSAIGLMDFRTNKLTGIGNSKSYTVVGAMVIIDQNKPIEKQIEALIECLVDKMITTKYGTTSATMMLSEGVAYAAIKNLGLDVRTYCLSEEFEKLAKIKEQYTAFLNLCKNNYTDFMAKIKA